jgi:hypothetical protein
MTKTPNFEAYLTKKRFTVKPFTRSAPEPETTTTERLTRSLRIRLNRPPAAPNAAPNTPTLPTYRNRCEVNPFSFI